MSESTAEYLFEHRVELADGTFANTVGSAEDMLGAYPVAFTDTAEIYIGPTQVDANGLAMNGINSVLRFKELEDGRIAEQGWTVPRACPVGDCGSCVLRAAGLTLSEMADKNCARANSAKAYEMASLDPEERFMLTATGKNVYVVSESDITPEYNGDELMQYRLSPAPAVVMPVSMLRERGLEKIGAGMSGADGSMVAASFETKRDTYIMFMVSMRQNMGDREHEDQLARKAVEAVFDYEGLTPDERLEEAQNMQVALTLSASASLSNFAHQIKVPAEDSAYATELREKYPDLIARSRKKTITSAIVLNDQYPGAMARGSIYPEFEAKAGIRETPITPDNCPGDGQYCHVDYRSETEYGLRRQLEFLGIPDEQISFDDSQALDPASSDNKMASNRAEQNHGIRVADTGRTLNAMAVWLDASEELNK